MKIKLLFLLLILTLNSYAQYTVTIRKKIVCEAFWQMFEQDSLIFEFQNIEDEVINFQLITTRIDTSINPLSCDPINFNLESYIITKYSFSCEDISKMLFYYKGKYLEKASFYIEVYDNTGNYAGEKLLFKMIYKKDD